MKYHEKFAWEVKDNKLILHYDFDNWLQISGKSYVGFLKEIMQEYGDLILEESPFHIKHISDELNNLV